MSYPLPLPDETNAVSPASYRNEPTIVPLAAYPNLPPAAYPNMLYPKKSRSLTWRCLPVIRTVRHLFLIRSIHPAGPMSWTFTMKRIGQ